MLFRVAIIPGLFAAALLTGCAHTPSPTYVPATGEPTARLNLKHAGPNAVWVCWGESLARLRPDEDGYATIPAGQRVAISDSYHQANGDCTPAGSFMPAAGQKYSNYFKIDVKDGHSICYMNILQEDNKDPDRLQRVYSMAAGKCL
jgi:hypothetical protein